MPSFASDSQPRRGRARQQSSPSVFNVDAHQASNHSGGTVDSQALFDQEDFQGHGAIFSISSKEDLESTNTAYPDTATRPNLTLPAYLSSDLQSPSDQILGSSLSPGLDQLPPGIDYDFEHSGLLDPSLSQDLHDGQGLVLPWDNTQERRARVITGPETPGLMQPPGKKMRTADSGYNSTTTRQQQQSPLPPPSSSQRRPRRLTRSVVSAPVHHYPDPGISGLPPVQTFMSSFPNASPFTGVQTDAAPAPSVDTQSMASHSDLGHSHAGNNSNVIRKTSSQTKKQRAQAERPHHCHLKGCPYVIKGFATKNDLDRHLKTRHQLTSENDRFWKCLVPGCPKHKKDWPRRDNFKAHLIRMHKLDEWEAEDYMTRSEEQWNATPRASEDVRMLENRPETVQPIELHKNFSMQFRQPPPFNQQARNIGFPVAGIGGDYVPTNYRSEYPSTNLFPRPQPGSTQVPMTGSGPSHDQKGKRKDREEESEMSNWPDPFSNYSYGGNSTTQPGASHHVGSFSNAAYGQFLSNPPGWPPLPDKPFTSHTIADPEDSRFRSQQIAHERQQDMFATHDPHIGGPSHADVVGIGKAVDPFLESDMARFVNVDKDEDTDTQQPADINLTNSDVQTHDALVANLGNWHLRDVMELPKRHPVRLSLVKMLSDSNNEPDSLLDPRSVPQKLIHEEADGPKMFRCLAMVKGDNGGDQLCGKVFTKKSELRKHKLRHEKRFACTFGCQNKRFGTKHEWKRHEHSQHEEHECWRCDQDGVQQYCGAVFHEKEEFKRHLAESHKLEEPTINDKVSHCRIARRFQGQFWCGFCQAVRPNDARIGTEKDKKRYDHITSHIDAGFSMNQWVPLVNKGKNTLQDSGNAHYNFNKSTSSRVDDNSDDDEENDYEEVSPTAESIASRMDFSPIGMSSTSPTSASTFKTRDSMRLSQSIQSHSYASGKRKTSLEVPIHFRQRPRAASDVGQVISRAMYEFICCKCGNGPQRLKPDFKCRFCSHQLPCELCDAFDEKHKRFLGKVSYPDLPSLTSNVSPRIQIRDEKGDDVPMDDV